MSAPMRYTIIDDDESVPAPAPVPAPVPSSDSIETIFASMLPITNPIL